MGGGFSHVAPMTEQKLPPGVYPDTDMRPVVSVMAALALCSLVACTRSARGGSDRAASPALDRACTPRFSLKLLDTGPKGALFTEAVKGKPEA